MTQYLNRENSSENLKPVIKDFALPYDPETLVRIKQQPMARLERNAEFQKKGTAAARHDTYLLIAESVVDEHGERIWDNDDAKTLSEAKSELITALINMIGKCAGGSENEVEELAGNLEETA